jgi:dTDP-4-amino-4,6-dideoxygalactose transaminase
VPFHLQPCFAYLGHAEGEFPVAEAAARQSLAIPIYGELTADQQQQVVDVIAQFTNMRAGAV